MKPYATDWIEIRPGLHYSKRLNLYWYKGRVYDELSAKHNGIIGPGYALKEILKCKPLQEPST